MGVRHVALKRAPTSLDSCDRRPPVVLNRTRPTIVAVGTVSRTAIGHGVVAVPVERERRHVCN